MATNVITTAPAETSSTVADGLDQPMGNAAGGEEVRNKRTYSNNNQHPTPQGEIAEHNCSTSVLQGSGNTVTNPLQLDHSSSEPALEKNPALRPHDLQMAACAGNNSLVEPALDDLFPEENPLRPQDLQMAACAGNNSLVEPAPDDLSPGENSLPPQDLQLAALAGNNSLVQTACDELSLRENPLRSQDLQLEVLPGKNSLIEPAPGEVSQGENPLPPQDPQLAALPGNNNVNEPAAPNEIHPAENLVSPVAELDVIAEQGPGIINSLGQVDGEHHDEQSDSQSAVSGLNEDVHQPQNADQAVRPNLLTQNSCYEQPNDFRDEEGKS